MKPAGCGFIPRAKNADRYDDYATYREDLIGTYVLHIPYFGKIQAFFDQLERAFDVRDRGADPGGV